MLSLKNFPKALVQYARTKGKVTNMLSDSILYGYSCYRKFERGKKFGVVVALDKDILGWSLCNKKDKFDKEKGVAIALGRAALASEMSLSERSNYYDQVPQSLVKVFEEMRERSKKYFQSND